MFRGTAKQACSKIVLLYKKTVFNRKIFVGEMFILSAMDSHVTCLLTNRF